MGLHADFDAATVKAKTLTSASTDEQLALYKYFKQATIGDVNIPQPGMFDFTGKAKWAAWESVKGMSEEDAQTAYIALVTKLSGGA